MPYKIFYLDDEVEILKLFVDSFSALDLEIETFLEPEKFMEAVKGKCPDLLIIDYRLPGITGDEIAKTLNLSIPKILVTGDINIKPIYPFEAIVYKPYRLAQMHSLIMKYYPVKKLA